MSGNSLWKSGIVLGALALAEACARGDVFHMPAGQVSLTMTTVGNPGNAADTRFATPGFGAVGYTYQIGIGDVTAGQYTQFLSSVAVADPYGLYNPNMDAGFNSSGCNIQRSGSPGSYSYSVPADWANRPVNFVSWADAARFANWLTNGQPTGSESPLTTEDGSYYINGATSDTALMAVARKAGARFVIPTEDEWYKAAYHKNDGATGNYWLYPTATNTTPLNVLATPDPGNQANFIESPGTGTGGYTIGSPYYRTPVGAFANSKSPYGTFDQGGNVWQWNETAVAGFARGFRGGSYDFNSSYLAASSRNFDDPLIEVANIGFRVASVPRPGGSLWNLNDAGNWNNPGNWLGIVPNGKDATAVLGSAITTPHLVYTDNLPITLGALTFDNPQTYTITGGAPNGTLTLQATGTAAISVVHGSHQINLPLAFASSTGIDVAGGATLTIADPVTVSPGKTVAKTGNGSLLVEVQLAGGTITVNGGMVVIGPQATVASSALAVSGSGRLSGSGTLRNVPLVYASSAASVFQGSITGTGGLTVGGGSLVLTGTNTYSGATSVLSGTLVVGGVDALPNGNSLSVGGVWQPGAAPAGAEAFAPPAATARSVPEPATAVYMTAAALCVLADLWRRRKHERCL